MAVQLRPCPHVFGYFLIRNVFFQDRQKFRRPHIRGFVADLLRATRESGFRNNWIRWMRKEGSCIGKEKVADSKVREDEYVWTGP